MDRCKNCNAEIPEGARFCPGCGQDQTALFAAQERIQTPVANVPMPQSPQGGPGTWVGQGFGWGLGGCLFAGLLFIGGPLLLLVGCLALAAGSGG